MRKPKRRRGCGIGFVLALAAFFGAIMCMSVFSLKILLISLAVLLIALGIFLLRL
ncbi:MAG: hypothetical protein KIG62_03555 [Oscillospiraceae bacterium]|nr:hypothetical protein [Oscillospiraceae bacterium]